MLGCALVNGLGEYMPNPNLDALIRRDDFDVIEDLGVAQSSYRDTIEISCLERGHFFYESLRKPDFQRETSAWSPQRVHDFIQTFLDGDLVPAVILWGFKGDTFVIDGAHRLSALIAWVNDDYGDGRMSTDFYGSSGITKGQKKIADKTRSMVKASLGSYADYQAAAKDPDPTKPKVAARAKKLGSFGVKVQWVNNNDPKKAEECFMRINQSAVEIDETEMAIIRTREKPNGLATRALIHAGRGHKYWWSFTPSVKEEIENMAAEVFDMLFEPDLSGEESSVVKTLDLPVAGTGYSQESLRLVFEFVNLVNGFEPKMWAPPKKKTLKAEKSDAQQPEFPDDTDGSRTVECLRVVRRITRRMSSIHPSSLGLHPAVYFYSATGRYQPAAFLAITNFVMDLDKHRKIDTFISVRHKFEEFILSRQYFVNQIVRSAGGWTKSLSTLTAFYSLVLDSIAEGLSHGKIIKSLKADSRLAFLQEITEEDIQRGVNFSSATKSSVVLKKALDTAMKCEICGSRLHFKSITVDHKQRKQDGGIGRSDNAALSHPYCNTGYKEGNVAKERKAAKN